MLRKRLQIISLYYFVFITCCVVLTSFVFRFINGYHTLITKESIQSALTVGSIHGVVFFFALPYTKRKFVARLEQMQWLSSSNIVFSEKSMKSDLKIQELYNLIKSKYKIVAFNSKEQTISFLMKESVKSLGHGVVIKRSHSDNTFQLQVSSSKPLRRKYNGAVIDEIVHYIESAK